MKDAGDIPATLKVTQTMVCNVGHPGVCKGRDAAHYNYSGGLQGNIHEFILRSPGLQAGSGFSLEGFSADGLKLHRADFLVAYVRKSDPVIVVSAALEADPEDGVYRLKGDGTMLEMCTAAGIALAFARHMCSRVTISAADVGSIIGTCGRVTFRLAGHPKDVYGGDALVRKLQKAAVAAAKAAAAAAPAPDIAAVMEAGFAEAHNKAAIGKRPVLAGVVPTGAILPNGADLGSAPASSGPGSSADSAVKPAAHALDLIVDAPAVAPAADEGEVVSDSGGLEDALGAAGAVIEKKTAASKLKYEGFPVRSQDLSRVVGYLKYNRNSGSLDAHCEEHKAAGTACHMNRALFPHPAASRAAQGRPVGHLVAWLWGGCRGDCDKGQHAKMRRGQGEFASRVSHDMRCRAREFILNDPTFREWMRRNGVEERAQREGEFQEPVNIP